ncbi:Choline-sulfatase [Acidisarcina polymorpha]|uniref:Choline-sulfatase n=1 Tax=Acidisarcina polymorpha TaxID=2211140 RepID=A0A2Z5FVT9_9BACT|nr:sulfatase-like hydrolase/transferase [Acidisarcina polymorpha]AXC10627.1 Choline-sulfatase [Acidisarcina polymorpha]
MKRRDFLKSTAAVTGGSLMSGLGLSKLSAQNAPNKSNQPNILFILVDELRYPSVFPKGITDAAGFFKQFMPHVYDLWQRGVKFDNYHTAANACTPSRGVMITGLYSQQNWLLTTIISPPIITNPLLYKQPVLNSAYPTYGKLLRKLGYQTPYRGKWHVSLARKPDDMGNNGLEDYGFDYATYPDPTGFNLQGTYGDWQHGYHSDIYTSIQAAEFLSGVKPGDTPFCLTASFVNPHDREFFPAGTEFQTFTNLFSPDSGVNPNNYAQGASYPGTGPQVPWDENMLKTPPDYDFPDLPPNWENAADWKKQNKPSTQGFIKTFSEYIWGGISEDPSQTGFTIEEYPAKDLHGGVAKAPFSYWKRGLNSYAQVIKKVDGEIGRVLDTLYSLPDSIVDNTVIVFVSDHGEYSGAHGLPQGKLATMYEEAWHVPLIVVDPRGQLTGDIDDIRTGLTSSVDLMPMLVSIGAGGSTDWMRGPLAAMYGGRHDMLSMLKSKDAPGRPYVLHATDEIAPDYFNPGGAPTHVLGYRTDAFKFGVYADWLKTTSIIKKSSAEFEFYDYATERGRMELENTTCDPRAEEAFQLLTNYIIPNELQQKLPPPYRLKQIESKVAHLVYRKLVESEQPDTTWLQGGLFSILGYGGQF